MPNKTLLKTQNTGSIVMNPGPNDETLKTRGQNSNVTHNDDDIMVQL